jgi:alcohol dehydrogenase class IV
LRHIVSAIEKMAEAALQVQRLLANNPREVSYKDAVDIYTDVYNGTLD